MKKMKKILAMLLSMAMVLGMTVTAFAGNNTATITVSGITTGQGMDGANVQYAQIIRPTAITGTNTTGWEFTNEEYLKAYETAYGTKGVVETINKLVSKNINKMAEDVDTKTAISAASEKVGQWIDGASNVTTGTANWNVTSPGIYVIKIQQGDHTYLPMAAYVGFGKMQETSDGQYEYPDMYDASLTAKGAPISVTKTSDATKNVVSVGDIVTYTIKTQIPYIESQDLQTATYGISDTITGAEYVGLDEAVIGYEDANGTISPIEGINGESIDYTEGSNTFTLNLSSLLADNKNAGKTVVVEYKAKIKEIDNIKNTANAGHISAGKVDTTYGTGSTDLFTGETKIVKYDVKDNTKFLPGAGFEVRADENGSPLTFTQISEGIYMYDPEGDITQIMTAGEAGEATVKGLNLGTYYFKEVIAPDKYTINEKSETAEIYTEVAVVKAADEIKSHNARMGDTTISSLPSTGGIGTTIFTIGGCAIMIIAAGLYFSFRKKSAK